MCVVSLWGECVCDECVLGFCGVCVVSVCGKCVERGGGDGFVETT